MFRVIILTVKSIGASVACLSMNLPNTKFNVFANLTLSCFTLCLTLFFVDIGRLTCYHGRNKEKIVNFKFRPIKFPKLLSLMEQKSNRLNHVFSTPGTFITSFLKNNIKTNQLEIDTDVKTFRTYAKLKEPRDLFALPKELDCPQQAPRWPTECQVCAPL